jgi:hypothetical protein
MESKSKECYMNVFEFLKQIAPDFAPTDGYSDFEAAIISGLQEAFDELRATGCWFHFAQVSSILKKHRCVIHRGLSMSAPIKIFSGTS